jgi:predicted ATP-binding protein involved in virulence
MDSKIKLFLILFLVPFFLCAQNKSLKKYVDSSELQLKLFASEYFYSIQLKLTDSSNCKCNVDIFMPQYFQNSNYDYEAIKLIWDYTKQEALKNYNSDEIGKCYCYNSSLLFYRSDKLDKKVKQLRKYLNNPTR